MQRKLKGKPAREARRMISGGSHSKYKVNIMGTEGRTGARSASEDFRGVPLGIQSDTKDTKAKTGARRAPGSFGVFHSKYKGNTTVTQG